MEGKVALSALDLADVGLVQLTLVGECLLAEPQSLALLPRWFWGWYAYMANHIRLKTLSPEIIDDKISARAES